MTHPPDPFEDWLARQPVQPLEPRPGAFERVARTARRRRGVKALGGGTALLAVLLGATVVVRSLIGVEPPANPSPALPPPSSAAGPAPTQVAPSATGQAPESPAQSAGRASRCRSGQLRVAVTTDPAGGAAGSYGLRLVFTNTGTGSCAMYGYPGVSFVTGPTGQQVNSPAQRASGAHGTVTLRPGGSAYATLLMVQPGNYPAGTCQPVTIAGFRVYPPDETVPLYAASSQQVCSAAGTGLSTVYPVQAGG